MILTLTDADCPMRVVSDVHIDYMYSYIRRAKQLEPLFCNVKTLIFNGDTVEQRSKHRRDWKRHIDDLQKLGAKFNIRVIFVTGNHDPHVSKTHAIKIGTSIIHHGDLFTTVSESPQNLQTALQKLHDHRAYRATVDRPGTIWHYIPSLRFVWRAWKNAPVRAEQHLQKAEDPYSLLIMGHTHYSGHWQFAQERHLLNTGSMFPLGNSYVVDVLDSHTFVLRKLHKGLYRKVRIGHAIITINT